MLRSTRYAVSRVFFSPVPLPQAKEASSIHRGPYDLNAASRIGASPPDPGRQDGAAPPPSHDMGPVQFSQQRTGHTELPRPLAVRPHQSPHQIRHMSSYLKPSLVQAILNLLKKQKQPLPLREDIEQELAKKTEVQLQTMLTALQQKEYPDFSDPAKQMSASLGLSAIKLFKWAKTYEVSLSIDETRTVCRFSHHESLDAKTSDEIVYLANYFGFPASTNAGHKCPLTHLNEPSSYLSSANPEGGHGAKVGERGGAYVVFKPAFGVMVSKQVLIQVLGIEKEMEYLAVIDPPKPNIPGVPPKIVVPFSPLSKQIEDLKTSIHRKMNEYYEKQGIQTGPRGNDSTIRFGEILNWLRQEPQVIVVRSIPQRNIVEMRALSETKRQRAALDDRPVIPAPNPQDPLEKLVLEIGASLLESISDEDALPALKELQRILANLIESDC